MTGLAWTCVGGMMMTDARHDQSDDRPCVTACEMVGVVDRLTVATRRRGAALTFPLPNERAAEKLKMAIHTALS